jgi:hydrogenase maturation protease
MSQFHHARVTSPAAEILVLGLGNPLMADDGVGTAVVEELRRRYASQKLRTEVAPDILHLRSIWQGEPRVWLVDAVQRSDPPGTLHVLSYSEMVAVQGRHLSAHQLSLTEGLRWLIHTYPELGRVDFRLWGVEPSTLAPTAGLSSQVAAAVEKLASAIATGAARGRFAGCD